MHYFTALSVLLIAHVLSDFPIQRFFYRRFETAFMQWKTVKMMNFIFSLNPLHALIDLKFTLHRAHEPSEGAFWDKLALDQVLHLISCIILAIPFAFL